MVPATRGVDTAAAALNLKVASQAFGNASELVERGSRAAAGHALQLASSSILAAYPAVRQFGIDTTGLEGARSIATDFARTYGAGHDRRLPDTDFDQQADVVSNALAQLNRAAGLVQPALSQPTIVNRGAW